MIVSKLFYLFALILLAMKSIAKTIYSPEEVIDKDKLVRVLFSRLAMADKNTEELSKESSEEKEDVHRH